MRRIEWHSILRSILFLLAVCVPCSLARGTVVYVDAAATGGSNGSSWQDAFGSLQDALRAATDADKPVEIRVAQGTYRPDEGSGLTLGDPNASFALISGVAIRGGYAGLGHPDPDARDAATYETILSGELDDQNRSTTNSYHVVTGSGVDATAILDDCTIAYGACLQRYENGKGAGMTIVHGSPTIIDCTFRDNQASLGAALYIVGDSRPALNNCTFSQNYAFQYGTVYVGSRPIFTDCTFTDNSGGSGGAIYTTTGSQPSLIRCRFRSNQSWGGGAVYNNESMARFTDCVFESNSTGGAGGGVFSRGGHPVLLRCLFKENSAGGSGGAAFNLDVAEAAYTNCLFVNNSADTGAAMENSHRGHTTLTNCTFANNVAEESGGALASAYDAETTLTHCILWANEPNETSGDGMTFTYCDVRGGASGEGNIDADPLYANPNADYHLKSQAGRWSSDRQCWVLDRVTSPCIDAGLPADVNTLNEPQPNNGYLNMGVYGNTPEASLSWTDSLAATNKASHAYPPNGDIEIRPPIILSWTAGQNAVSHDVYLGRTYEEVAGSNRDNPVALVSQGQTTTSYTPVEPPLLGCYWRVDEIDSQGNVIRGDIWNFVSSMTKGRACFTPETPVWVDGALVPISRTCVSQAVDDVRGPVDVSVSLRCMGTIQQVQEHEGTFICYDIILETGHCISVASCHYFMSDCGRWIALQEIRAGTKLKTVGGSVAVVSVRKWATPYVGKVYNLKIGKADHYLVGEDAVIARDY